MNSKAVIAIAVVAVLVIGGGVGTYFLLKDDGYEASYDGKAFNLISRVNSEGSGLYVKNDIATGDGIPVRASNNVPFFGDGYSLSDANKAAWGGLVFADPGASSIQHTQLATIASDVGLSFEQYREGTSKNDNTLYYVTNISDAGKVDTNKALIDGGILWEPQFQRIIQEQSATFKTLALTNDVFDGHTCCVIAANHDWLNANKDTAVKFLAGYIKAVDYINKAKANPAGPEYADIKQIAMDTTLGLDEIEVSAALANITYLYADDEKGSLGELTGDVSDLASSLDDIGLITSSKFKSPGNFAKAFVDDSYIKSAVAGEAKTEGTATIDVAAINGDIHQLAIHVAKAKGYFDEYGLTVNVNTSSDNGGAIATLLLSGDVKIGFLGAPPATLNTINGDHILIK